MDDFVRVFPSMSSIAIRNSIAVLHYAPPPPPDPPIDYTLKVKHTHSVNSHRNISEVPWKPDQKSKSVQNDQKSTNVRPDYINWSKQEQNSVPKPHPRRHTTQIIPAPVAKIPRNTVEESATVLEDLDHILDSEESSLSQKMKKVEIRRGRSLPRSLPPAAAVEEKEDGRSPPKIPVTSNFKLRREQTIGPTATAPDPLRHITRRPSSYTEDVIERRKSRVEDMYKETERKIEEAVRLYTPEYFRKRMVSSSALPLWKCELMARKQSNETIQKIQEEAWQEFAEWKRLYAPHISIQPTWRNKRKPILP